MERDDASVARVEIGLVVEGRYRVDGLLGAGGMGVVARARDLRLDRDVALKFLSSATIGDLGARARLLREARAMAAFEHPHVAHVYDAGETADGGAYLAMELVVGETVRSKLRSAWPVRERLRALIDAARALGAAHAVGLIHRDVKPDNLMVRKDGRVVLLDFGIVRRREVDPLGNDPTTSKLTGKDAIIGTLAYMSPEQALADELDGRSDQFSFGVTAFEVLTGEHPWPTATHAALLSAILTQKTPRASERASVSADLDAALARAMAKEPRDRFPTMEALADALEAASTSASAQVEHDAPADGSSDAGTASDAFAKTEIATPTPSFDARGSAARPVERPRGRALAAGVAFALVAFAAGIGAWIATRHARPNEMVAQSASAPSVATTSSAAPEVELEELAAGTQNQEARQAFLAGVRAWHDGDLERAHRGWDQARELDPAFVAPDLWRAADAALSDVIYARSLYEKVAASHATLSGTNEELAQALIPCIQKEPPDNAACVLRLRAACERRPDDALLAGWLAWTRLGTEWPSTSVLDDIDRALELDPTLVQMLGAKAQTLAYLGRFDEALATTASCEAKAPSASSCLATEAFVLLQRGDCRPLSDLARRWRAVDSQAPGPYLFLAGSALDERQPVEAVRELLAQDESRTPEAMRPLEVLSNRIYADVLAGDFADTEQATKDAASLVAALPDRASHVAWAVPAIELARETGRLDEAGRIAEGLMLRLGSWQADPRAEDWAMSKDGEPYLLDVLVESGRLSERDRAERRDAWLRAWRARAVPFFHPYLWLYAYGGLVHDQRGASEALATLPAGGVPTFYPPILPALFAPDAGLGQMYLLAGRPQESLPFLRKITRGCVGIWTPWQYVRGFLALGQALEATGEKSGACAAYQSVLTSWGKAQPRSTTAEKAKALSLRLGCKP
ncbi:MAG: protein kinase [Polyangiaceae bacterium]